MLRRWPLSLLVIAGGCLYTGSRNDPPSMTIILPETAIYRGQPVEANIVISDDQHDVNVVRQLMKLQLHDAQNQPVADCVGTVVQSASGAQIVVYTPGTYTLEVTSSDELGAVASQTRQFTVVDAAPFFSPADAHPQADSLANACHAYTAGQVIAVQLDGTAVDPDADPIPPATATCTVSDETLSYTWSVVTAPAGANPALGPTVGGVCPAAAAAGAGTTLTLVDAKAQVCLYTDALVAGDAPGYYALGVTVSDGVNPPVAAQPQQQMGVVSDQPPCITGTVPGGGLRVIDRTEPQTFTITGVTDDLDPYGSQLLTYAWSVWRTSDPNWRAVTDDDPSYTLDTSGFDVGEDVQVRVEVFDRNLKPADCTADVDECFETSCLVGGQNSCMRWMTWSLELR
ncbi:MAG TPA: hypothetical protein VIA18_16955 [Polyangia bacterium]|nr:hypothetical protein [Polyangia bacterium]